MIRGYSFILLIFWVVPTYSLNLSSMEFEKFPACAVKILQKYPGKILSIEAEQSKNNQLHYEFDIFVPQSRRIFEIECNPEDLTLNDIEEEVKPHDPRFLSRNPIDVESAERLALKGINGLIVGREFSIQQNSILYEFDILLDNNLEVEVEIDAQTGKVLEREIEIFSVGYNITSDINY